MRRLLRPAMLLMVSLAVPTMALAQDGNRQIQGFGGLTASGINASPTFGGSISVPITSHVHVIAEGGRMRDITSPALASLIDLSPVDVRLSALYGKAGVRVLGPNGAVRPYVEGSAGFARVRPEVSGFGNRQDAIVNLGLQFLDRTQPMVGGGAGVLLQGGPLLMDLGYRYTRFSSGNPLQSALTFGDLDVHQMRVGIGIRW